MHIATVSKINSHGEKRIYYRLCESYRTSLGQPRKRMLCALGYLEELPELNDRMLLLKSIENLAYRKQLPITFLQSKGWNKDDINFSMMQIIARAIKPL